MTPTTQSPNGFSTPTVPSSFLTKLEEGTTSQVKGTFVSVVPTSRIPENCVSVDDLIERWKSSNKDHSLLSAAREWVADKLYGDQPGSLRSLRLRKGMSQTDLAQIVGTSQSHIARIEQKSDDIRLSTARKIADALEISLDDLNHALLSKSAE